MSSIAGNSVAKRAAGLAAAAIFALGLSVTAKVEPAQAGNNWVAPAIAGFVVGAAVANSRYRYWGGPAYPAYRAYPAYPAYPAYYPPRYGYPYYPVRRRVYYPYPTPYGGYGGAVVVPAPGISVGIGW